MSRLKKAAVEVRDDWTKKKALLKDITNMLPDILRAFLYLVRDEYRGIVYETIKEIAETFY